MSWTDERVELLGKLWLEGRSASQIAAELGMGVTRNAVIGKVHRLGLAGRPKSATPVVGAARGKLKVAARSPEADTTDAKVDVDIVVMPLPEESAEIVPLRQPVSEVLLPISERVTIMELRESSCRWPMGDPMKADFRFCGARTGGANGPYCTAHARLAFQPAPERRRDRVERFAKIA